MLALYLRAFQMLVHEIWAHCSGRPSFDQFEILAEPGHVLRVMKARLGQEVSEVLHHLESHHILIVNLGFLHLFVEQRQGIFAVPLETEEPGLMVDAGDPMAGLLVGCTNVLGEGHRGMLDAVTEADKAHVGGHAHGPRDNRGRILVVQHQGIRT